jgi:hypothetical protein
MDRSSPEVIADELRRDRFPAASVVIVGGSVVRGEGTRYSDLDIVVLFDKVDCAYRQSLVYKDWPVECFVHDMETLKYFFEEMDAKSGCPSLPFMVAEGITLPGENDLSMQAKRLAQAVINAGPAELDKQDLDRRRYAITDIIDDIRDPRSQSELMASGARLMEELADYYFRSHRLWSARGKTIFRRFQQVDARLGQRFDRSFRMLFVDSDPSACIALAEEILGEHGGFLFNGYRLDAPTSWRSNRV